MSEQFFADAESSQTIPQIASQLRVGGYVVLRGFPCKIAQMSTCKTGKHGGAKVSLIAVDIFTGKKYEEHFMSEDNVDVPLVTKNEYQLKSIDWDDEFLSLIDAKGCSRDDLKLPADETLKEKIANTHDNQDILDQDEVIIVTSIAAMGKEQIYAVSTKKI